MDGEQQTEFKHNEVKGKVNKVIEDNEDNLQTHFVENPFLKMREKATEKERAGKVLLG